MKRIQVLPLYFGSIYGDFGHAAIDSPQSLAENPKTMLLTFDQTLTLHVTFLRKFKVLISIVLVRAFHRACDPWFGRYGGRGKYCPPPAIVVGVGGARWAIAHPLLKVGGPAIGFGPPTFPKGPFAKFSPVFLRHRFT